MQLYNYKQFSSINARTASAAACGSSESSATMTCNREVVFNAVMLQFGEGTLNDVKSLLSASGLGGYVYSGHGHPTSSLSFFVVTPLDYPMHASNLEWMVWDFLNIGFASGADFVVWDFNEHCRQDAANVVGDFVSHIEGQSMSWSGSVDCDKVEGPLKGVSLFNATPDCDGTNAGMKPDDMITRKEDLAFSSLSLQCNEALPEDVANFARARGWDATLSSLKGHSASTPNFVFGVVFDQPMPQRYSDELIHNLTESGFAAGETCRTWHFNQPIP